MGVAKKVQFRGGTTTSHQSFTGADREVTVDTTKKTLVVHDGITPGGVPLAKELETQNSLDLKADKSDTYTKTEVLGSFGRLSSPLLDLPLQNSLSMKAGVGSTTFTRASTATYIDRYGVLKTAGIDEPRFEKEGYLNEGSSTNLFLYSTDLTNANVLKARSTVNVALNESIDGVSSFLVRETAENNSHTIYQSINFTSGTTYTLSIYVKAKERNVVQIDLPDSHFPAFIWLRVNLNNGTVLDKASILTDDDVLIKPLDKGWYRISVTATADVSGAGNISCRLCLSDGTPAYMGDGNSGLYVASPQVEALPFATSYIPTTSSTVTRSADVLQVTRENNFPNAENNPEGYSVAYTYDSLGIAAGTQQLWTLYVNTNNSVRGFLTGVPNSLRNYVAKDGVSLSNSIILVNPLGSNRVVQTQSNTLLKQYINGTLVGTNVNTLGTLGGGVNSLTNITVGGISGISTANLFGHISDFKVYDRELTPVEVALL